jgi:CDP-glucose 4,6-dehydratase
MPHSGLARPDPSFWHERRVLITGHTGFKGGWLAIWLERLGAAVSGIGLAPQTNPSLYELALIGRRIDSIFADIREERGIEQFFAERQPEVVFHLAAQPLVRRSYREPVATFATNIMGTAHLLEAVRRTTSVRAVVVVTSDKCYADRGSSMAYREDDRLGGDDPYSASKACAELITASYQKSFCHGVEAAIATARAGNVIGGGDWSEDRLVPDMIRALGSHEMVSLRNPHAIRPWQHVIEPLCGYLILAERLFLEGRRWASSWNFGPFPKDALEVYQVADRIVRYWGSGEWEARPQASAPHETVDLRLDSMKAREILGWRPRLSLDDAFRLTVDWYRSVKNGDDAYDVTSEQIAQFQALAAIRETAVGFEIE